MLGEELRILVYTFIYCIKNNYLNNVSNVSNEECFHKGISNSVLISFLCDEKSV